LPECLESVKPIADEIIFIDTGSTDQSMTIAKNFDAKVFSQEWDYNFSKPRNLSLELATGNWVLIIDADEVISSRDYNTLKKLTAAPATTPTAYQILTRNYITRNDLVGGSTNNGSYPDVERGCGWIPSIKTRLWSNNSNIRFSYPVHETVSPSLKKIGIVAQPCPIIIHHYGKLDQLQADKKGKEYFNLGLKKLEEMGGAATPLRELAIQAGILGHFKEAANLWQKLLEIDNQNAEAYLNLGTALFNLGKIKDALQAAEKSSQLNSKLKESHFNRALYELHLGRATAAAKRLKKLLQQVPDYSAAQFIHSAAICCRHGSKAGQHAFLSIKENGISAKMIEIAGTELAKTLLKAGRKKDAEKIKKATSN